jgi:hypothetical protein
MKLIIENWRGFVNERQVESVLLETLSKLENNEKLEESVFRNLLASIGLGAAAMFWTAQNERADDIASAVAEIHQNIQELDSDQEKLAELEELLKNPGAWNWSDDPSGGLGYPKIEIDDEWHTIMPDSWSIAAKVAADKAAGVVDIPGMAVGDLPSDGELYKSLKTTARGEGTGPVDLTNFKAELGDYLTPTTDHGSTLKGMGGQMSPPGPAPDYDTHQMSSVAVDADYFEANPDYMTSNGVSAKDLYIKYYFGQFLGVEEAAQFGLEFQPAGLHQ